MPITPFRSRQPAPIDPFIPTPLPDFYDGMYFDEGATPRLWSIATGTVVVSGGVLEVTNGHAIADGVYWNCIYKLRMRTVEPGENPWNVGRVVFRFQNWDNRYELILKTDGELELGAFKGGSWVGGLATASGVGDPLLWHEFKVRLEGANIRVWVDGSLRINYTDPDPLLWGRVGMAGDSSRAQGDDFTVVRIV